MFTVWSWGEMECLMAVNSTVLPRTCRCVGARGECPSDKYFFLLVIFSVSQMYHPGHDRP